MSSKLFVGMTSTSFEQNIFFLFLHYVPACKMSSFIKKRELYESSKLLTSLHWSRYLPEIAVTNSALTLLCNNSYNGRSRMFYLSLKRRIVHYDFAAFLKDKMQNKNKALMHMPFSLFNK